MTVSQRFQSVLEWFRLNMPVAEPELHFKNPFQLLVAVMLSAQCTDKRVNLVTPSLFEAFPSPESLANASIGQVLSHIRSVSYPNSKAAHLVAMAQCLLRNFDGTVPASINDLQSLPGVGRKTASVVMAVAFGSPAMPVDTHVFRVSHRLGLVPEKATTPLAVEKVLRKHIPEAEWTLAHHWLLLHGRYVCTARSPHCVQCGLAPWCKTNAHR
ncbi:MAG: endonuclease III [Paludibacteraceae bacterium]|nr:endonuclease III [Paludibacteraceae bacterium]